MARYVRVLASLILIAVVTAAHAQTYECTQVVLTPGLATAYASAQCQTTNNCHPGSGCALTLQMLEASIVGSAQSTAYQVPVPPLYCVIGFPDLCIPQWQFVSISMVGGDSFVLIGRFDGPLVTVNGHYEATGDFNLRDELFADGFDR